jgi:bifunctional non-homologous end joining protein LigD
MKHNCRLTGRGRVVSRQKPLIAGWHNRRSTAQLPEGPLFAYEHKLDGFRAQAIKSGGKVELRSRNNKDFNRKYPTIVKALAAMPDETVIDGEVVALDPSGRPSFNALQNFGAGAATIVFYAFDPMVVNGRDVTSERLTARRALLSQVLEAVGGETQQVSSSIAASAVANRTSSELDHGLRRRQ